MDTLENKNISGKRVKIIDEDNDAIWGTVETIDYVKGKIGLMADGQNGRLEYYFKCDIKKIFVIDDSGGAADTKDDRRAFESNVSDKRAFQSNVSDKRAFESNVSDKRAFQSNVGSGLGDRKFVDSSSINSDKTFYSLSSNTRSSNSESGKRDSGEQVFGEERCGEIVSKETHERKVGGSDLDKESKISVKHLRKSDKPEIPNHIKASSKCDKQNNNFGKEDISSERENNESCDLSNGIKLVNISSESGIYSNTRYVKDDKHPDRLSKRGIKTQNEHLGNLHPVDPNKLFDREKMERTGELESYVDEAEFPFLMLPSISSRTSLCKDMNGQGANPSKQQKVIRDLLWKSPTEAPVFHTPTRLYNIQKLDDLYEEAVERIRLEPVIGVNLEGELLGRVGRLCFLLISTPQDVFMFDILQLGKDGFTCGLKAVLQDQNIVKVLHDARQPSDILFHQYDVSLANVFDTLAADIVFQLNWSVHRGFIQQYARALNHLAKEYLGVLDEDLFFPKYRRSRLKEDTSIWKQRPLPNDLVLGAARRTIYLLPLRDICSSAVKLPFARGVSALLSCVRDADDSDAAAMVHETALLPSQVRNVLVTGDVEC